LLFEKGVLLFEKGILLFEKGFAIWKGNFAIWKGVLLFGKGILPFEKGVLPFEELQNPATSWLNVFIDIDWLYLGQFLSITVLVRTEASQKFYARTSFVQKHVQVSSFTSLIVECFTQGWRHAKYMSNIFNL
jgi:hypothetical protein